MKKKLIFILFALSFASLISIIGIKSFNSKETKQDKILNIQENKEVKSEEKVSEPNQKEQKNSKKETIMEVDKKIDNSVSNDKITISSSTTSTNTNENKNVEETPNQNPVVSEEKSAVNTEQPKPTNSYVGVPSPNDFYYSFHKGHIDKNYITLDGCYSRTADVSLLDTIDIINTTCFEVLDGQGTVLGIYMYVKCNSGNCERYKSLVGIETN